jgi:hypothetical protein
MLDMPVLVDDKILSPRRRRVEVELTGRTRELTEDEHESADGPLSRLGETKGGRSGPVRGGEFYYTKISTARNMVMGGNRRLPLIRGREF